MIGWAKPATDLAGLEKALSDFSSLLGLLGLAFPDLVFDDYESFKAVRLLLPPECYDGHDRVRYASFVLRYEDPYADPA